MPTRRRTTGARCRRPTETGTARALERIVELLPPAWQYPEFASARLRLGDRTWTTRGFRNRSWRQASEIVVGGVRRGEVEVVYSRALPARDEGPFLKEERNLITGVAREIALLEERWRSEAARERMAGQLRHADRLATLGQLAAGVAHELNEPLAAILGFAQLLEKSRHLTGQAARDLGKISVAALHAREIVRKLLLFARQRPPQATPVDLNRLVEDGLYLLESRCTKAGIRLVRELARGLPPLHADPSQLHQVLVNLVVNAIQAMPEGGTIALRTSGGAKQVKLVVEDEGVGMPPEVLRQVFVPFFTTKDVGQGTGLGLSVAHGIVTAHGGTIHVESTVGRGSRFAIRLPAAPAETTEGSE